MKQRAETSGGSVDRVCVVGAQGGCTISALVFVCVVRCRKTGNLFMRTCVLTGRNRGARCTLYTDMMGDKEALICSLLL